MDAVVCRRRNVGIRGQGWLARFGLRLNIKKTEYLTTDEHESGTIKINGTDLPRAATFRYLGSVVSSDGSLSHEITARVNAAWLKWRSLTGVLCDKNIPDRFKSKIHRTVVRPVALYGAECWPATKEMERRISVMEMRMLRWMGGITQLDRISNQDIRQRFGVVAIANKLREARLRWFGHVLRAKGDKVCRIGYDLDVAGKRPKGRPKQRWLDTLHADLKLARIHPDQAHDRAIWRPRISKADPLRNGKNAEEEEVLMNWYTAVCGTHRIYRFSETTGPSTRSGIRKRRGFDVCPVL